MIERLDIVTFVTISFSYAGFVLYTNQCYWIVKFLIFFICLNPNIYFISSNRKINIKFTF
jgi:hypothetical protein